MKSQFLIRSFLLGIVPIATTLPSAHAQTIEVATESDLASISLPENTLRFATKDIPKPVSDVLESLVKAGGPQVKRGKSEMFGWSTKDVDKEGVESRKRLIAAALKRAGWQYEENDALDSTPGAKMVTVSRTTPTKRGLIGFWYLTDEALLLTWTEMLPIAGSKPAPIIEPAMGVAKPATAKPTRTADLTFQVPGGAGRHVINVMKNAKAKKPAFPALTPKKGFVRGYAKDSQGNPIVGATIGVRSSSAGGFYSGANGKTDAKGYYEIEVPWGAAHFYNAAISRDWGKEGRGAFGLAPADGEVSSFASAVGLVENWVLLPYGITDPDEVSDQPQYFGNYFGGSFSVSYFAADPRFENDGGLPIGSEIDVTLSPIGTSIDGSPGKIINFRQPVEEGIALGFSAVNIPVGLYRINVNMRQDGKVRPLNFQESGPKASQSFGLEPKNGNGSALLLFRPNGAKSTDVPAGKSNWDTLAILLKP